MPNWCSNSIAFYQEDGGSDRLAKFYADINRTYGLLRGGKPKHAESPDWAGHFLKDHGVDVENLYTRGFLEYYEIEETHVRIDMETAWGPIPELYTEMAKVYDLKFVYCASEPGSEVYVNTDKEGRFFADRYMLDSFSVKDLEIDKKALSQYGEALKKIEDESQYFDSLEDLLEFFADFNFGATDFAGLKEKLGELDVKIYEYEGEENAA